MNSRISPIVSHLSLATDCGSRDGCVTAAAYADTEAEYKCVRSRVGIGDLNHYAKIHVAGDTALDLLNYVILTDVARLPINQLQATVLLNDDGSPCAEAFVANYGDHFLVLGEGIAAATLFARLAGLADSRFVGAIVTDQTEALGLLGLDGPFSWELLKAFMGVSVIGTRYLEILADQALDGVPFTLYRAGKTGEYGYMLLTSADKSAELWDKLCELGKRFEMLPLGYRVIDLCKLENRFMSQHHEGSQVGNVLELNTRVLVSRDKGDYAGRAQIEGSIDVGLQRRVIGLTFAENMKAGANALQVSDAVSCDGVQIGKLASLGYSHTLQRWIALGLVDTAYSYVGLDYAVAEHRARTVSAPFIFNRSMQIRPQEDSYFN